MQAVQTAAPSAQTPPENAPTDAQRARVAVLLLQLGGPVDVRGIEPFLANLFEDVLPLPRLMRRRLAEFIAKKRTPKVQPLYEAMGGGSPLLCNTEAQAGALGQALKMLNIDAQVHTCMRFAPPRAADALAHLRAHAADRPWIVLPLYPHFSHSTTRSSLRELQAMLTPQEQAAVRVIDTYCSDPGYLDAQAEAVAAALAEVPPEARAEAHVLFSAHGLPMSLIRAGDPYAHQISASVTGIAQRLQLGARAVLAYQSRVGPVRWLQPSTPDMLQSLGARGIKHVVVVPISFVSEHIETLQELDVELREVAEAAGITGYHRARTLGTQPQFISALARLVQQALKRRGTPASP